MMGVCFGTLSLLAVSCASAPPVEEEPAPAPREEVSVEAAPTLVDLVRRGDRDALAELFGLQVDLNQQDADGMTALHHAARQGDAPTVEVLLHRGAAPDTRNNNRETPLHLAVRGGHTPVVQLLADRNASLFAQDNTDTSVLDSALERGGEVLAAIINQQTVSQRDTEGLTVLHYAAARGNVPMAERALAAGASPSPDGPFAPAGAAAPAETPSVVLPVDLALAEERSGDHVEVAALLIRNGSPHPADNQFRYFDQIIRDRDVGLRFENRESGLHLAARQGHGGILELLVREGAEVDARDALERTPLLVAVRAGDRHAVQFLLENRADASRRDLRGYTIFHYALEGAAPREMVAGLLEHRVDPDLPGSRGVRALHIVVRDNHPVDFLALLAEGGADLNARDEEGTTALHLAMEGGESRQEAASLLVQLGASLFSRNNKGETPASMAVQHGEATLSWLLDITGTAVRDENGANLLHYAALGDSRESAGYLVERGVSAVERNRPGDSPLHTAVQHASPAVASVLLAGGGDLFLRNTAGATPLAIAFSREDAWWSAFFQPDVVARRDAAGNTLLHHATREGDLRAMAGLLSLGASPEERNRTDQTVLHHAAAYGDPAAVSLLLRYRAAVDARDARGNTPLHLVQGRHAVDIAFLLSMNGVMLDAANGEGRTPLHEAVRRGNSSLAEFLVDRGAFPDARDNLGRSPLFDAARSGSVELAGILLGGGAAPDLRDLNGNTVLHVAVQEGHYGVAAQLRSSGADIFAEDRNGNTVVDLALEQGVPMTAALVDRSVINRQNNRGETVIHRAARRSVSREVLTYLLTLEPDPRVRSASGITSGELMAEMNHATQ